MDNLLSYDDFLRGILVNEGIEIPESVNEGHGIRGFFNKVAQARVKSELQEEIALSKQIMDSIQQGLDGLNDDMSGIKDELSDGKVKITGEKQKALESITKLLDDARQNTWDINDLIDEGEIDYAGFTANVGLATVTLFGVLLFPIRARILVHKGYNYFFATIRNTIRKALVMLQLNFDQFENLIITKSFQSLDYIQDRDAANEVSAAFGAITTSLFDKDKGSMKNKRGYHEMETALKAAKDKYLAQINMRKLEKQSSSAYNSLDMYQNTYTKSLETLRNYTQDDVQKHLDAIKTSMNKLAAGDVDLTAYGELIIATAEEHAYKVSSSIYTRFAKMTEVFSLPNQQKMIDLIQAATKEEQDNAKKQMEKKMKDEAFKEAEKLAKKINEGGEKIFLSIDSCSFEKDNDGNYVNISADGWTYEEFNKLQDEDKDVFRKWLGMHDEVLQKCDETLRTALPTIKNNGYYDYVDSLLHVISDCIVDKTGGKVNDGLIFGFDDFSDMVLEKKGKDKKKNKENEHGSSNNGVKADKDGKSEKGGYYLDLTNAEDKIGEIKYMYVEKENVARVALELIGREVIDSNSFIKVTNKNAKLNKSDKPETRKDSVDLIDLIKSACGDGNKDKKSEMSRSTYTTLVDSLKDIRDVINHEGEQKIKEENTKKSEE